jgi:hypothetical protein
VLTSVLSYYPTLGFTEDRHIFTLKSEDESIKGLERGLAWEGAYQGCHQARFGNEQTTPAINLRWHLISRAVIKIVSFSNSEDFGACRSDLHKSRHLAR